MSLVDRIRGEKRKPAMPHGDYMGHDSPWAMPVPLEGYVIDGVVTPLDGQPPTARSHGWGDMGWLGLRRILR